MHALFETHDTLLSWLEITPCGLGVASFFHVRPFQRSEKGWSAVSPTAMHIVLETQLTE